MEIGMLKKIIGLLLLLSLFHNLLFAQQPGVNMHGDFPEIKILYKPDTKPGTEPILFAQNVKNEKYIARDFILHNEYEIFFLINAVDYSYAAIYHSNFVNGKWSEPAIAAFSQDTRFKNFEPFITPDGNKFFFVSNRPVNGFEKAEYDFDIWVMDKTDEGWSDPENLGLPVNTKRLEAFPSVTKRGALYFVRNDEAMTRSDVYRSKIIKGKYSEPEILPEAINGAGDDNAFNACISPDEDYLIFCSYRKEGNFGKSDYYISFRNGNDNWSEAKNMGPKFNSEDFEVSPHITSDGKYIIYSKGKNVYWVSAKVVDEFK